MNLEEQQLLANSGFVSAQRQCWHFHCSSGDIAEIQEQSSFFGGRSFRVRIFKGREASKTWKLGTLPEALNFIAPLIESIERQFGNEPVRADPGEPGTLKMCSGRECQSFVKAGDPGSFVATALPPELGGQWLQRPLCQDCRTKLPLQRVRDPSTMNECDFVDPVHLRWGPPPT